MSASREQIKNIIKGKDPRFMVVVGPCSIHDPKAAIEYAERLAKLAKQVSDQLFLIMRVYFEKPRTTIGWKGLINDPDMNGSHLISKGLGIARSLLCKMTELKLPGGNRDARPDHSRIPGGHALLGCDRCPHHRITDSSGAGQRPLLPDRLQKRHRRQPADRDRRHDRSAASPLLPRHQP